ncbi:MAG: hypothetical protein QM817_02640 [Archangium sp.]
MPEALSDRALRTHLESLQRELRDLKAERELIESPAFAAEREILNEDTASLAARLGRLTHHLAEDRATLIMISTRVRDTELAQRANEQRSLSSGVPAVALVLAFALAAFFMRVRPEACIAASGLLLGWLLAPRAVQLRATTPEGRALVWSWSGGLLCLFLAPIDVVLALRYEIEPLRQLPPERWILTVLPAVMIAIAAFTFWQGERRRIGLLLCVIATSLVALTAVPAAIDGVDRWLTFARADHLMLVEALSGLLAPVIVVAIATRWKPALLSSLMCAAAAWCVGSSTPAIWHRTWQQLWLSPGPVLSTGVQLAVGAVACATFIPGRWRWALVVIALGTLQWAFVLIETMVSH